MTLPAHPANTYLAGRLAERYAVDLLAYSGFEWPKDFLDGDNPVSEKIHDAGLSFAVNARRFLEHTEEKPVIKETFYVPGSSINDPMIEHSLLKALHGIIHSRKLQIQYSPKNPSSYTNAEGAVPVYFLYETDRYPQKKASIFGIAWTFLTMKKPEFAAD